MHNDLLTISVLHQTVYKEGSIWSVFHKCFRLKYRLTTCQTIINIKKQKAKIEVTVKGQTSHPTVFTIIQLHTYWHC